MIRTIVETIINKLIGQVEIWANEFGVMFEPIVIPIIVNTKFLRKIGIENFNPRIALMEQIIVGPRRNGAGNFIYHAKTAPKDPSTIDTINSTVDFLFLDESIILFLIPLK